MDLRLCSGFNGGICNAQAAANSYIQGWVDQLHVPSPQVAGVYGSTCASGLDNYASLNPFPDFIWGASYDNNQSTSVMPCVNSGHWWAQQRLKQYVGPHDETWGGVTLNIDTDCSNGPGAPTGTNQAPACQ